MLSTWPGRVRSFRGGRAEADEGLQEVEPIGIGVEPRSGETLSGRSPRTTDDLLAAKQRFIRQLTRAHAGTVL